MIWVHTVAPEVFDSRLPEGRRMTRQEDCLPSFSYHLYFPPCYPVQPSVLSPSSPVPTGAAAFVCAQISFPRPALSFIISLPHTDSGGGCTSAITALHREAACVCMTHRGHIPPAHRGCNSSSRDSSFSLRLPLRQPPGADIQSWSLVLLPSMYASGVFCRSHSATPRPVCPSPGVV